MLILKDPRKSKSKQVDEYKTDLASFLKTVKHLNPISKHLNRELSQRFKIPLNILLFLTETKIHSDEYHNLCFEEGRSTL